MLTDARIALRSLLRQPGFTTVVVLTAALGIGATTTIFSVVHTVLLRPLPYDEPQGLVRVLNRNSFPDMEDWIQQNQTFTAFGGYNGWSVDLLLGETPERVQGAIVTGSLFPVLGVAPRLGRVIRPEDNVAGGERVVVLSHDFWQQRLAGASDVIGSTVSLNGNPTTIIGVMPEGFRLPGVDAAFWLPHRVESPDTAGARGVHFLISIGRLADGVSLEQAQADMDAIAERLEALYPEENTGRRFVLEPWRSQLASDSRPALLMLLGAVTMVLLIACANVAGLLLARTAKRQRELALRSALGASGGRMVRQLLIESAVLGVIGGALGLALASIGLRIVRALGPTDVPRLHEVSLDPVVLAFALVISLATGCLFGLAPAISVRRVALVDLMKKGMGRGGAGASHRLREALIVLEVAVAVVLLFGAGLLFKSLYRLHQVDPGFRRENLVTMDFLLPLPEFREIPKRIAFFDAVQERLRALPGVDGVAVTTELPYGGGAVPHNLALEGVPMAEGSEPEIFYRGISPDYFRVMGIPLLEGRGFTDLDREGTLPVAVVNEAFVRELTPGESPLGKRFRWARRDDVRWITIVGVVGDIKSFSLDADEVAAAYVPFRQEQDWWRNWMNVTLRSSQEPDTLVRPIGRAVAEIHPGLPVANVEPMERLVASSSSERRFHLSLFGAFAGGALFLAAVGVYGLLSFLVTERTGELGIRLALGAPRARVVSLVLRHGFFLAIVGLAVGGIGAMFVGRGLQSLLFEVTATDPLTFVAIAVVLLAVSVVASFLPAYRASCVDPLSSIRYE